MLPRNCREDGCAKAWRIKKHRRIKVVCCYQQYSATNLRGYLSRYSFQDSIRDRATLPLHFEAPEVKLKIDKAAIDEAYRQITGSLSEQDRDDLAKRAAKMAVLVKNPERIRAVVNHIVRHFQAKVEPNGFKAQVVVFDRECCVLYKAVMDELIGPEASAIVMSGGQDTPA